MTSFESSPRFYSHVLDCRLHVAGMLLALMPTSGSTAEPITFFGFDKASYSEAAGEGLDEIFSGRCFHNGFPISVIMAVTAATSESQSKLGYDPNSPEGRFYVAGSVASPPNRISGMAPGLFLGGSIQMRNGVVLANGNCFGCHAGIVNGQVVAGLANSHIDQITEFIRTSDLLAQQQQLTKALRSDAEKKEFAEAMTNIESSVITALQYARTRGDNLGPYSVWRIGAQLADPANKGIIATTEKTELTELIDSTKLPPVDPIAWWVLKYKKSDYWYADDGNDGAAQFSFNFTTRHPEANANRREHVKTTAKALAFARETLSPLFPKSLDENLVKIGADLFHGRTKPERSKGFVTCKSCHGSYTKKASQTDLGKPGSWAVAYNRSKILKNVKTDPSYNATLQKFRPIAEHINKLKIYFDAQGTPELAPRATVPSKPGYIAPPLVGVWASAPYFHNGSVPTIEAVLNSKQRPEIWSRNNTDPHAYDLKEVGMQYTTLPRSDFEKSAAKAAEANYLSKISVDHRSIYDTKEYGHGNMGHTFGDRLTADERSALIEFLKSLSGPDME